MPDESIKGRPKAVQRSICIVDDEELEKRKESRIPPNTRVNTSRAVRTWAEWAEERNGMIAIKGESGVTLPQVNSDILNITDNEELNYWLSRLVVTKKDSCYSLFVIFCRYCFVVRYICRSHYYRKFGPNLSRGRRDFISYDVNN